MSTLYQIGSLVGFLQGIYKSEFNLAQVATHGTIGLGTFNGVNGEMVGVDGQFYHINEHCIATPVSDQQCTPFAVVSPFKPVTPTQIHTIANLKDLNKLIDTLIPTPNIFYMIRIDGEFNDIQLRSEACHLHSDQKLAEALPKVQHKLTLESSVGTLVVTRCPKYSASFTIPGYHYHYIDTDKKIGGHVFNLSVKSAQVQINPLRDFRMMLIDSVDYDQANLDIDIWAALKKIE
jgi:acetolactate decarboxylase